MAQTAATNTDAFKGFLKPNEAAPYFEQTRNSSVVQTLARKVPLGINGEEVPVTTSKAKAKWVGQAQRKPTSESGIGLRTMRPHKIAAITVVSAEVVRANPGNYISIYKADVAESMAEAFDSAAFYGIDSPFDNYLAETSKAIELGATAKADGGAFADLNEALRLLVADKKVNENGDVIRRRKLSGFAFDALAEPDFGASVDAAGRPLFVSPNYENAVLTSGRVLGRPAAMTEGVANEDDSIYGFAGDFSRVVWGAVGGISYDVSTQATVTLDGELVSLWENNLVAIRSEAEFGLLIDDPEDFVKISPAGAIDDGNGGDDGGEGGDKGE